MQALLNLLRQLPPPLMYAVAALLVAGETASIVGLVAPGEATLLLVGFLAYTGTLRLGPALLIMVAAAVVGDALAFRSGRRFGHRIRVSRFGARVGEERWRRAEAMLGRLDGRGIFAARWLAFVRTLAPRLAGAAGMPYRRFAPWNLLGVLSWVGGSVLVGYLAGSSYQRVSELLGRATGAVLLLLTVLVGIVLVGRWLGRNPDPVRALGARAMALPPVRWASHRYGMVHRLLTRHLGAGWTFLINLATGLGLLLVGGLALAWTVRAAIDYSGLSAVDDAIATWVADRRTEPMTRVARDTAAVARGPVLIGAVALVALVLAVRRKVWRGDLVGLVGSAGASLPLVILAAVVHRLQLDRPASGGAPAQLLSTHDTVATASICMLAWLIARRGHWSRAAAVWTVAAAGIVLVTGARLYLGWDSASRTVGSVLLGALWIGVFMVAWSTLDRAAGAGAGTGVTADPQSSQFPCNEQ